MIFQNLPLIDAKLILIEKIEDERGFFARVFCQNEFEKNGVPSHFEQCNSSYNRQKGTLRGMHYQRAPYTEAKLVRCIKGSVYDVIIDLRFSSATYRRWFAIELKASEYKMLYIPKGFAHGYETLEDDSELLYQVSSPFMPEYSCGVRWNDPAFNIQWPLTPVVISKKDQEFLLTEP